MKYRIALVLLLTGCGASVGGGTGDREPQSGIPLAATFESINANILRPKCLSCHSGSRAPHGIDLSSLKKIMENNSFPPLLVPGDPKESSLYTSVLNGSMPKNRRRLNSRELEALRLWIEGLKSPDDDEPGDDNSEDNSDAGEPKDGWDPGEPQL
jgi:hypothetical protein